MFATIYICSSRHDMDALDEGYEIACDKDAYVNEAELEELGSGT